MKLFLIAKRRSFRQAAAALCFGAAALGLSVNSATAQVEGLEAEIAALPDFTGIIERTESSVVNIRTTETISASPHGFGRRGNDPYEMFRWFFGPDFMPPGMPEGRRGVPDEEGQRRTVPRGVGSGFIISDDGYILTNNHVVSGASEIFVTLTDGSEKTAEIIGTDARTDIALIKIDGDKYQPLPIGSSKDLKKGQWVLAIGSPFGLESTVTAGIVSAINRDTGDYLPFIQTDVAVNPGNSGGPLINLEGQVVGVNSQIVSRSGGFMGISLAIPIDEAMRVVEQLQSEGKVTRGRIGVQIGKVSDDVAEAIGLGDARGAMVSHVESDGPADKAGVKAGDVITAFNGKEIKHWTDLPRIVGETRPGTKAKIEVWRKGKSVTLKSTVAELESDEASRGSGPQSPDSAAPADALGLSVRDVPEALRAQAGISGGVEVVNARGPAAAAGIAPGDIILTVNAEDVTDAKQFAKLVSRLDNERAAALLVFRDGQTQWVPVRPNKK